MKNVKVSLTGEAYRTARIKAAERGASVSALVKRYLTKLGFGETEFQRFKRLEQELRARVPSDFRPSDNIARDQVHRRDA